MNSAFQLSVDSEGIATLLFDMPGEKVNKINLSILDELEKIIDQIKSRQDIKALIIRSGKEEVFIAGADLRMFEGVFNDPEKASKIIDAGHRTFKKIENLPFPTIALIQGVCLGGGLEMALACKFRIVTDHPKTSLGLPEVSLGIIPGWGGTQRLPRLIGLEKGVEMIVTGRPVDASKAYKFKIADAIFPWQFQNEHLKGFLKQILDPSYQKKILEKRKRKGVRSLLLEKNPLGRAFLFHQVKKQILAKTKGHYPAPLLALQVIKETYNLPLKEGIEKEKNAFLNSPEAFVHAKNLIAVFFANESLKKNPGVEMGDIKGKKVERAGLLGVGTMGAVIAWLISSKGVPVRFKEVTWDLVGKGYAHMREQYVQSVKSKKLKPWEMQLGMDRLSGTVDYTGFSQTDLIIEAIIENMDVKHKVLQELESSIPDSVVIGSNTSSLSVSEMAKVMKHPERFIGMHFFNPPNRMPLVEIVPGEKTSKETIATAVDFCKKLGKTALVVADCPGFLVNRIFAMGANEIVFLLQDGHSMDAIIKSMLDFGMPMDPFTLADEVGNDVTFKVVHIFEKAYGPRMKGPKLLDLMNEKKLYGKKVGRGFYIYQNNGRKLNPEIPKLLKEFKKNSHSPDSSEEMQERVFFSMINEAARCLEEKVVKNPSDLDMALILGIGFPPFHGGLLRYADKRGISNIVNSLKKFEASYGERFQPCNLLVEMDKQNKTFYTN